MQQTELHDASAYYKLLESSDYPLADQPEGIGWLIPTDPARPLEELHEQYRVQGYLWLKGLLDREEVLAFRRRYFAHFQYAGILAEGTDPIEGIYSGAHISGELAGRMWQEAILWPEYEQLCRSAQIVQFYEHFLGGEVHLLKRKLIRSNQPGANSTTPGHYDLIYLRGGADSVCTSWIPFGDCPVSMGGLVYLEGSDALGRRMEAEFTQKNAELSPEERVSAYNKNMAAGGWVGKDLRALATQIGGHWLIANYETGDMVVHSPYMIHASTKNFDPLRRMRLSTDIRYQRTSERIDPRWNKDLSPDDGL